MANKPSETDGKEARNKVEWSPNWRENADAQDFIDSRNRSKYAEFLSPITPDDLIGHKLFLSADGNVGAAVSPDGDIQNVFNNGGPKGAGSKALLAAVNAGAKTLDCYDGHLPKLYGNFGFTETGRMKFNREYAPETWDYDKFGEPDVVFMARTKFETNSQIMDKANDRAKWVKPRRSETYYDGSEWDEAKQASQVAGSSARTGGRSGQSANRTGSKSFRRSAGAHGRDLTSWPPALRKRLQVGGETIAAGLAIYALDTGRVLMLQRAISEDDPAAGKWEFPGGHLEDDERPIDAARREWSEETGLIVPHGELRGSWKSGIYEGFILEIDSESLVKLNPDAEDRSVLNPDDPDGDMIEVIAWWHLDQLIDNPAVRNELLESMPMVIKASKPSRQKSFRRAVKGIAKSVAMMPEIRDGDGDGMIYDGTDHERPADPNALGRSVAALPATLRLHRDRLGGFSDEQITFLYLRAKLEQEEQEKREKDNPRSFYGDDRDDGFYRDAYEEKIENAVKLLKDQIVQRGIDTGEMDAYLDSYDLGVVVDHPTPLDLVSSSDLDELTELQKRHGDAFRKFKEMKENLEPQDAVNDAQRAFREVGSKYADRAIMVTDKAHADFIAGLKQTTGLEGFDRVEVLRSNLAVIESAERELQDLPLEQAKLAGSMRVNLRRSAEYVRSELATAMAAEKPSNSYSATGRGGAMKAMRKASQSLAAAIKEYAPKYVTFTAAGESRVDLYRFLTKRSPNLFDGYIGVEIKEINESRASKGHFAIVDASERHEFMELVEKFVGTAEVIGEIKPKRRSQDRIFDDAFWDELFDQLIKPGEVE